MNESRFFLRQISVFLLNKPGTLSEITALLAENNIDMRAFTLTETRDFGTIRIIVDNVEKACQSLEDKGVNYNLVDVLAVTVDDKPGGMNDVIEVLSRYQVNIEYAYTTLNRSRQNAIVIVRANDMSKAARILEEESRTLLTEEELNGL